MGKAGGGGGGADTISGMWLLLELGRGEVGRAGRSAWLAAYRELSVALTCAGGSHPPSCPQPAPCPQLLDGAGGAACGSALAGPPRLAFLRMCKYFAEDK